jgi:hypothetical protein
MCPQTQHRSIGLASLPEALRQDSVASLNLLEVERLDRGANSSMHAIAVVRLLLWRSPAT